MKFRKKEFKKIIREAIEEIEEEEEGKLAKASSNMKEPKGGSIDMELAKNARLLTADQLEKIVNALIYAYQKTKDKQLIVMIKTLNRVRQGRAEAQSENNGENHKKISKGNYKKGC